MVLEQDQLHEKVFEKKLRNQEIDDKEIEIEIQDTGSATIDLQGSGGAGVGMINLNDMLGKAMGNKTRKKESQSWRFI